MKKIIFFTIWILALQGCTQAAEPIKKTSPKCGDINTKKLVLSIVIPPIKIQMIKIGGNFWENISPKLKKIIDFDSIQKGIDQSLIFSDRSKFEEILYSKFYTKAVDVLMSKDKYDLKEVDVKKLQNFKEYIEKVKFITLETIRTNKIDDQILKSECSAELKFIDDKKLPIKYDVQITSDGELYATVYNL
jgi:hypothetical protein